jgi:hypothetical protein
VQIPFLDLIAQDDVVRLRLDEDLNLDLGAAVAFFPVEVENRRPVFIEPGESERPALGQRLDGRDRDAGKRRPFDDDVANEAPRPSSTVSGDVERPVDAVLVYPGGRTRAFRCPRSSYTLEMDRGEAGLIHQVPKPPLRAKG